MGADVTQIASGIRLLLMDVDGVLTDGKLYNVPGDRKSTRLNSSHP
jgi:3-deoxy-D-manno-octulosonate 8-phosphate phosphatase KdsC-like HAD superfamily phosphatase